MKRTMIISVVTGLMLTLCLVSAAVSPADEADFWFQQGLTYFNQNLYGKALDCFDKAVTINPNDTKLLFHRGRVNFELAEFEKALADFNRTIELRQDIAGAYYWRGMTYEELKQTEKAIKDLDKAIEILPENTFYYSERANLYADHKDKYGIEPIIRDRRRACELGSYYDCQILQHLMKKK